MTDISGRHDIGDIVTRYGIDAVIERMTQLHAAGSHLAARCIARELSAQLPEICRDRVTPGGDVIRRYRSPRIADPRSSGDGSATPLLPASGRHPGSRPIPATDSISASATEGVHE